MSSVAGLGWAIGDRHIRDVLAFPLYRSLGDPGDGDGGSGSGGSGGGGTLAG